ncbi:MAG: antibiotic biosynthesis monooxygenase, partial [Cyanobacteria bacterium J06627_8]
MHQSYLPSEPVTVVISEAVAPSRLDDYEAWSHGINQVAQTYDGFMAVEVLRPRDNAYSEYVVIVRFDSYDHLRAWVSSDDYRHWIE